MSVKPKYLTNAEVISLAKNLHHGQYRRGPSKEDHFNHCYRIASRFKRSEIEFQVSLLHDTVEDTKATEEYLLQQRVDPIVVQAVMALSHRKGESYNDYILRVKQNPFARRVKVQDILDNLSGEPTQRARKKYAWALQQLITP